jgi:hypothetical protein
MLARQNKKRMHSILLSCIVLLPVGSFADESTRDTTLIPITTVFYGMGRHMVGSFIYNNGLNYIVGTAATYGLVESGVDWRWYQNAKDHPWISNTGRISVVAGPIV